MDLNQIAPPRRNNDGTGTSEGQSAESRAMASHAVDDRLCLRPVGGRPGIAGHHDYPDRYGTDYRLYKYQPETVRHRGQYLPFPDCGLSGLWLGSEAVSVQAISGYAC